MPTTATPHESATSPIPPYRKVVRRALPDHYFKPDASFLLWMPFHAVVIGLSLWLISCHFQVWSALLVGLAIGHSFGCLGFMGHAVAHGQCIRKAWLRDLVAGILFSPFAIGPLLWRKWHNAEHHNNTQIEGVDPDHLFTLEGYRASPVLQAMYRLHPVLRNLVIFGSFTFRMTQQSLRMLFRYLRSPHTPGREKLILTAQLVIPACAWVLGTFWLGQNVFWFGYVIPLLWANALVIGYIATNHFLNPLADESDVLGSSLSVTLPKPIRWLDSMHSYFGAHVSHHLFPQAAPKYSRQIEAKIAEIYPDRYHVMSWPQALKALWNTPWVYENKTVLIDPKTEERKGTLGHGLEL